MKRTLILAGALVLCGAAVSALATTRTVTTLADSVPSSLLGLY